MARAVTIVPCGHVFNEDTVIKCIAHGNLCPLDRKPIERHLPNYTVRALVETTSSLPPEESHSEEAEAHFLRWKKASDEGDIEGAIEAFLEALQLSPFYTKAQNYLDFCLDRSLSSPSSSTPIEDPIASQATTYELLQRLLRLLDNPKIHQNAPLAEIFSQKINVLFDTPENASLSPQDQVFYRQIVNLLDQEGKVRKVVQEQLLNRSPFNTSVTPLATSSVSTTTAMTPSSSAILIEASSSLSTLPAIAFGRKKWQTYFGDIGVEPSLPSNIQEILTSPCPFWPNKTIQETHLLVLIPSHIDGKPLTLQFLGELVQHPKLGNAAMYGNVQGDDSSQTGKNHWILMTKNVVPGSRERTVQYHTSYMQDSAIFGHPYHLPPLIDAAIAIFTHYVETGEELYGRVPETWTTCQDLAHVPGDRRTIGGFFKSENHGLLYINFGGKYAHSSLGAGAVWQL
jgi:hypothetical protein